MKKDFDEFQTRMGFRLPNDVFDILKQAKRQVKRLTSWKPLPLSLWECIYLNLITIGSMRLEQLS